jgi:hypothetical protein
MLVRVSGDHNIPFFSYYSIKKIHVFYMPLCERCKGSGEVTESDEWGRIVKVTCPMCHGSGDDNGLIDISDDLLG